MVISVREESTAGIANLAEIRIAFVVDRVFDVTGESSAFTLHERAIQHPYTKDYDAIDDNHPTDWTRTFDMRNWGFLTAVEQDSHRVGAAVIAFDTDDVDLLKGRKDLAVLWDLRVRPDKRGSGIGRTLFEAVELWAVRHECRELLVETQNVNVAACRFYQRLGCTLSAANRGAYSAFPDELQLLWTKRL